MYSYQSALFDDTLMPKAPQKAVLANAIWTRFPPDIVGPTGEVQHVLDGGVLLHLITWAHEFPTYQEICALYCHYVPRWLPHSIHQVHNTSTGHRRQSRNRGHLHRRYEVDDVERCLPFERRQQTELHRHVESLPAACWMPHRTRGGGCRPVDCANSSAIGSYEEHCHPGRRYRSGHPAMLLRRSRWLRLVHAVFDTGDNEEEPHLGYQSYPK